MSQALYEEEYNELVDIYSFVTCLLELATFKYPYAECANAAPIYKKVYKGIKPASLEKVKYVGVRAFMQKCIVKITDKLTAKELLMDSCGGLDEDNKLLRQTLPCNPNTSVCPVLLTEQIERFEGFSARGKSSLHSAGSRKGPNTIFWNLRIADSAGSYTEYPFPLKFEIDTPISVASEMVEELNLTDQDMSFIAAMINSEFCSYVPDHVSTALYGDNFNSKLGNSDATPSEDAETLEGINDVDDNMQEKQDSALANLQSDEDKIATNLDFCNGLYRMGENNEIVRIVAEKLEHLLIEQQKELQQLRWKHE
ncbi:Non-specific serine/threonine protein kinase [Bertholletia excelsa]